MEATPSLIFVFRGFESGEKLLLIVSKVFGIKIVDLALNRDDLFASDSIQFDGAIIVNLEFIF